MTTVARTSGSLLSLLLAAALLARPTVASAGEADQRAAAQVLFDQGKALVERGSFAEACPKFQESLRLDRGLGTMLWLADCFENNGQTASAWVEFKEAAAAAALARDAREKVARDRAAALEPKLSRLTINIPAPSSIRGLQVRRDGVILGAPEWGVGVPVDPGVHTVAANAPGRRSWTSQVTVAPRSGAIAVSVPLLELGSPDPMTEAPDTKVGSTQRYVGLGLVGLGVVGAGVGAFLGLRAKSTYDDSNANAHCLPDNECDATGKRLRSDASGLATGSTLAFALGATAIAGGLVVYFVAPKSAPAPVALGVRGTSLTLAGSF